MKQENSVWFKSKKRTYTPCTHPDVFIAFIMIKWCHSKIMWHKGLMNRIEEQKIMTWSV
jgi:hypothetical protein